MKLTLSENRTGTADLPEDKPGEPFTEDSSRYPETAFDPHESVDIAGE